MGTKSGGGGGGGGGVLCCVVLCAFVVYLFCWMFHYASLSVGVLRQVSRVIKLKQN